MPTMTPLQLKIDGMHCDACVRRVTNALGKVPGVEVEQVQVGSASVKYDGAAVSPAVVAGAVRAIGFEVSGV